MNLLEKVLETLCVVATIIFFIAMTIMVAGQAIAVFMLDGELSARLSQWIAGPAGNVSGIATFLAIILGYLRKQMSSS